MAKKDLVSGIKQYLNELYSFKIADINAILGRLGDLPDSALEEILNILKEGKGKQDEFLAKMNKKDKQFNFGLKKFLNTAREKVTKDFTEQECDSAEDILKQL